MTKPKLLPVIDSKDLVRDTQSKALLATNRAMLEEHRQKKQFLTKLLNQSEELETMKKDISDIKFLLHKLVQDK